MCILEAGHYYAAKGPTQWSALGWDIMNCFRGEQDKTMLFVDDVHPITNVSSHEIGLPARHFPCEPDFLVRESEVYEHAMRALELLKPLHKKRRCRQSRSGEWFVADFPVTHNKGNPTCVLLDTGLTIMKTELGFTEGVNVLPFYYEKEQRHLKRILGRILPDFRLTVRLFDLDGNHWEMP